jgi:hypothetical protein
MDITHNIVRKQSTLLASSNLTEENHFQSLFQVFHITNYNIKRTVKILNKYDIHNCLHDIAFHTCYILFSLGASIILKVLHVSDMYKRVS